MSRVIESLGILSFLLLAGSSLYRLLQPALLESLALSLLAMPLAYYCADLLSGLVHWVCDSFGCSTTPVWGPLLIAPFRRHHQTPLQITTISLAENLGSSAIGGTAVLWLVFPAASSGLGWAQSWLGHFWLWLVIFAVISNLFHRWSHIPLQHKPGWMKFMQKWHLILNSQEHLTHHQRPYRHNYCILCGWANPLTNRIPWDRLESGLALVGIKTNFD